MANLKDIYELVDVSSESENEEETDRASTPLPKDAFPNIRVILEFSHSSIEANADLEESGEYPNSHKNYEDGEIIENPESPDECNTNDITNSGIFIVESHRQSSSQSVDSAIITEYLEQVANADADSYLVTPPGPLKRINTITASPLNDLEERGDARIPPGKSVEKNSYGRYPCQKFQLRLPGYAARPMTVALSQSALGLECGCRRVGYGRSHGCTAKLAKRCFGF